MQQFDLWRTTKIEEAPQEEMGQAEGADTVKLSSIVPDVTTQALETVVKPPPATLFTRTVVTGNVEKYEGTQAVLSPNQSNPKRARFSESIPASKLKVCITLTLTLVMSDVTRKKNLDNFSSGYAQRSGRCFSCDPSLFA